MKTVLVTGGAGYIGSHTCVELLNNGYQVIVVDNLSNSSHTSLECVEKLCENKLTLYCIDLLDIEKLRKVFFRHRPDAVIHFAAFKSVVESVTDPLRYYHNNLTGTLSLLECMKDVGCKRLVFSSSSTVYGKPEQLPINENNRLSATNPYGHTKLMTEQICRDLVKSDSSWKIAMLRYFNPIGAHPSGRIGEDPHGVPNNLMPYLLKVATGKLPYLTVHGNDWPTIDGTGVRDYIHVVDLSIGHLAALNKLDSLGFSAINLGTGKGYSVLQIKDALEKASGIIIPYQIGPRRPGDIAICYADPSLAEQLLGWKATRSLDDMCIDSWRWQQNNPNGF